jgi:hypothetical protein
MDDLAFLLAEHCNPNHGRGGQDNKAVAEKIQFRSGVSFGCNETHERFL